MRKTDPIDKRIKKLNLSAGPELDRRIDSLLQQSGPCRPLNTWSLIMTSPITRYAAAAVLIVAALAGLYKVTGSVDGSSVAWADVLTHVTQAKTVTFQSTVQNDKVSVTSLIMQMEPGLYRSENLLTGSITVRNWADNTTMHLMPKSRKALIRRTIGPPSPGQVQNRYAWLKTLHEQNTEFVGRQFLDGAKVNVFISKHPYAQTTVWTDRVTNLPVKVECQSFRNPKADFPIPEMYMSDREFGNTSNSTIATKVTAQSASRTGGLGLIDAFTITYFNFNWNADLDPSLFSMIPPQDYQVTEKVINNEQQLSREESLAHALKFWANTSDNRFPDSIDQIGDPNEIKPKILQQFDSDGNPRAEFEAALDEAQKIFRGVSFVLERKLQGDWAYVGSGTTLGQLDTVIFWWFDEEMEQYRAIFADLSIRDITAEQRPDR